MQARRHAGTAMLAGSFLTMLLILGIGGFHVISAAVDRMIVRDAEIASSHWAGYFARNFERVELVAGGAELTGEDRTFIARAREVGRIFRFKLFDTNGQLRLVSDELHKNRPGGETLTDHNASAARVVETGRPYTVVADGKGKPNRPPLYADMGGQIGVESEPGKGSNFWFDVTLEADGENADRKKKGNVPMKGDIVGSRVLVADDNETNRAILHEQLESWELDVATCASGEELLLVIDAAHGEEMQPDLVILDYQMPSMTGLEVLQRLQADPRFCDIPVIVLTSVDDHDVSRQLAAAGAFASLVKPARSSLILETMCAALQPGSASSAGPAAGWQQLFAMADESIAGEIPMPAPASREEQQAIVKAGFSEAPVECSAGAGDKGYILVAEDNHVNQIVIQQILEEGGHEYSIAGNGRIALRMWEERKPLLVLMDVSMPEMNGMEATAAIRAAEQDQGLDHTKIIVVTAHALKGDRETYLAGGADDYVSKPVSPDALLAVIARHLPHEDRMSASA